MKIKGINKYYDVKTWKDVCAIKDINDFLMVKEQYINAVIDKAFNEVEDYEKAN